MAVVEITQSNFETTVMHSQLPVLLEFGAEWCGPCKTVEPELQALSAELDGKCVVAKCDIDRSPELAKALRIQSVPTFVVFHEGRPVGGQPGALNRVQLRQMVEQYLPRAAGALRPEEVIQLVKQGQAVPVDTREAPVFGRAHIPGAVNMPIDEIESRLAELHMLTGIPVLVCRSGDQTKTLTERLAAQGVEVAFMEGGVLGWEGAGFALERPDD